VLALQTVDQVEVDNSVPAVIGEDLEELVRVFEEADFATEPFK